MASTVQCERVLESGRQAKWKVTSDGDLPFECDKLTESEPVK